MAKMSLSRKARKLARKMSRLPSFSIDLSQVPGFRGKRYGGQDGLKLIRSIEGKLSRQIAEEREMAKIEGEIVSFHGPTGKLITERAWKEVQTRYLLEEWALEHEAWQEQFHNGKIGHIDRFIPGSHPAASTMRRRRKASKSVATPQLTIVPPPTPIAAITEMVVEPDVATGEPVVRRRLKKRVPTKIAAEG